VWGYRFGRIMDFEMVEMARGGQALEVYEEYMAKDIKKRL
jgi:hypothetical protein